MTTRSHGIKRALDRLEAARGRGLTADELAQNENKGFEIAIQLVREGLVEVTRNNQFVLTEYSRFGRRPFVVVDDDRRPRVDAGERDYQTPDYERRVIGRVPHPREIHGPPASRADRQIAVRSANETDAAIKCCKERRKEPHRRPWEEAGMSRRSWYRHVYPRLTRVSGASA